jgi:hypothetical protein
VSKRREVEMKSYLFEGKVTISGVAFYIDAASEDEARERAERGDYDSYDIGGGSTEDWTIHADTLKENR